MSIKSEVTIGIGAPAPEDVKPVGGCGGECGCGGGGEPAADVLDVRAVPASIRHATVFAALGAVPERASLILRAPHDPVRLLDELEETEPGAFQVDYEQSGPEVWQLRLTRTV